MASAPRTTRILRTPRWRAGMALLVLAIAACSSGDAATTTTTPPALSTPSTMAGSPVVELPTVATDDDDQGIGPPTPDELDPSAELPRLCIMLSLEEVSAAIGVDATFCQQGVFRQVTTAFVHDAAEENVMSLAAGPPSEFTDALAAADARPIDGLGDRAVWSDGRLHVLVADEDLSFKLFPAAGVADSDAESVIETIAVTTLERYQPPPPDDAAP
jgi:hypothetical protein